MGRAFLATLIVASAAVAGVTAVPPAASASPHDFTDPIFSADARGDITTIGNVTTECNPAYTNVNWSAAESLAACTAANDGSDTMLDNNGNPRPPINNRLDMEFVDVDGDGSTFASSSADLVVPAGSTVLWAGLHWNAASNVPDPTNANYGSTYEVAPINTAARFTAKLRAPGGTYTALAADDTWDDTNPGGTVSYGGYVDITSTVQAAGSGAYTVADVQSCRGFGGCFGSWSITVAYANEAEPARNLNVWHGWELTTPTVNGGIQEFTVAGLTPPPAGAVNARIGVVQADGDRTLGPDTLEISSPSTGWTPFTTPLNPADDFFRSVISTGQTGNPNRVYNLNTDIALVERDDVIGNTDTQFSFRVRTAGTESLYSQVVHTAVDLFEPEIAVDKTVNPVGPVSTGDEVTWTIKVDNAGIDPINNAVVADPLPTGVTYVPGSIIYASGGPAAILGPKTDGTGDDQANYDAGSRTLTFNVGTGASAVSGGTMGVAPAGDGSDTLLITFRTTVDVGADQSVTNTADAYGEGRALDDPYGPITTTATDPEAIRVGPVADLGITKTDDGAVVRAVGDQFTYTLEARNAGPSAATGVTITDDLDPMLGFVSSPDGCIAAGQMVTCPIGNMANGATTTVAFIVEVVALPGAGNEIPNLATVGGNEPNPDCVPATPDALCNTDTEQTPQPNIDLGIVKTDGDAHISGLGDEFTYSLEVTNAGPDDATGVRVTDPLDDRLEFVGSSNGCSAVGQDVTCLIGDLAAGDTTTVSFTVAAIALPDPGGVIPNTATVEANEPDPDCVPATPDALCNTDTEETPGPESDLGITKTDDDAVVRAVGDKFTYTFVVTNAGPDTEPNPQVIDVLPSEIKFASSPDGCTADGQDVTCELDALEADGQVQVKVVVEVVTMPAVGEQIHNIATIGGDNPNPDCVEPTPDAWCNTDDEDTPRTTPKPPAKPSQPSTPPGITRGTLPRTGASIGATVGVGLLLAGAGWTLLAYRKRRGLDLAAQTAHPHGLDT